MPIAKLSSITYLGYDQMKNLQHSRPLFFGVLAGAFAPAILAAALLVLSPERSMIPVLPSAFLAFLIALGGSVIIGLPLALWLRSRQWLTVAPLCVVGILVGAIALAAFNFQINYWPQMNVQSLAKSIATNSAMKGALAGAIFGAISSAAFCLGAGIAVRPR